MIDVAFTIPAWFAWLIVAMLWVFLALSIVQAVLSWKIQKLKKRLAEGKNDG